MLAWADHASADALIRVDPAIYPEWRPLAYATIWLEHRLVQLSEVAAHHAVNILLWALCAWLVFLIVDALTASPFSALAAAGLLLVDQRAGSAVIWIVERQMTLACACGLAAILILVRSGPTVLSWRAALLMTALLLASPLGKEYGLAFALAIAIHGAVHRRRDHLVPAVLAAATYAGLRLIILNGGALNRYCEEMGFFVEASMQCVAPLQGENWRQMLYNSGATLVGSVVPGLLSDDGALLLRPARLALAIPVLALAAVGAAARPRVGVLAGLVTLLTAALSFYLYRHRNQLPVACVLAMLAGCGLAAWQRLLAHVGSTRLLRTALAAGISVAALLQVVRSHERLRREVIEAVSAEPCEVDVAHRDFVAAFAQRVTIRYDLPNTSCLPRE